MSVSAQDIARAAVAAAAAQLEQNGMQSKLRDLDMLLADAARERSGMVLLTITTPTGDIGPFAQTIANAVEKKTGKRVELRQKTDPSLVGGAIVQYGDERIDFSVRGALRNAEDDLTHHDA